MFMLESGYEVVSVEDYDLGWQVMLKKKDVLARIIRSRGEEEIYFQASTASPDEFTDIGSVIYAATGDKIPRWESSNPKVIKQYLDKIESYFEGRYLRNKDSLRAAQEQYYAAFSQEDVVPRTAEEEFYAQFSPRGIVPPAPKRKPLLHYPLMGMIILLILGALTTLCMILAERLFSFF
jgi:hypothetical protein